MWSSPSWRCGTTDAKVEAACASEAAFSSRRCSFLPLRRVAARRMPRARSRRLALNASTTPIAAATIATSRERRRIASNSRQASPPASTRTSSARKIATAAAGYARAALASAAGRRRRVCRSDRHVSKTTRAARTIASKTVRVAMRALPSRNRMVGSTAGCPARLARNRVPPTLPSAVLVRATSRASAEVEVAELAATADSRAPAACTGATAALANASR